MDDAEAMSHLVAIRRGWDDQRRVQALADYRAFLSKAAARTAGSARPSLDVDELWHAHILSTRSYSDYCLSRFGRYIHHQSGLHAGEREALSLRLDGELPAVLARAAAAADSYRAPDAEGGAPLRSADCGAEDPAPEEPEPPHIARLANCGDDEVPEPDPGHDDGPTARSRPWRDAPITAFQH